ncbi:MAG: PaaI family thioesterase [Aeromicrobium sp.]
MSESSKTVTWQDPRPTATIAMQLNGLEFLGQIVSGELPPPPISQTLGFHLVKVEEGEAFFEATPDDSHYNPIGIVHASLAMTMLDSAAACAVHSTLPVGLAYTSLETKVSFLRAVTSASGTLTAHGWVTKPGRRAAFAEADLRDADGNVYATASSSCLVYPVG